LQLEMNDDREYDSLIQRLIHVTERSAEIHFLGKLFLSAVVFCGISTLTVMVVAQTVPAHVPVSTVSDWTHHHVLYPASHEVSATGRFGDARVVDDRAIDSHVTNGSVVGTPVIGAPVIGGPVIDGRFTHALFRDDPFRDDRFTDDPRRMQSWYVRHPEGWWPKRYPPYRWGARRDWSVPLGVAYYEPLFDSTFTFVIGTQIGSGDLIAADLGGGELLATAGDLSVTGGSDVGLYQLFPGGPGVTASPGGSFNYDDLLFPAQNPVVDFDGLLFLGGGLQVNLFGNGASNYSFWSHSAGTGYTEINSPGSIVPLVNPNPDPGGGQVFPAKYVFDLSEAPSCSSDFAVVGIPTSQIVDGQANIIGVNNLYSNPGGTGFCTGTGPTVMFAYTSGSGQVPGSVVISQNGQQVAYVENQAGISFFHVLTIGTTGTNGTGATSPVQPGNGNNAVDTRVQLSPDGGITSQSSTTSPFVVYTPNDATDWAYATTYDMTGSGSGYLYKISNVFNGSTPTVVWSVAINAIPSTPVYDKASNKVFFTDSSGRIDYVLDSGTPTVVHSAVVAAGTTSENPVIVDSTNEMVYASFNSNGTNAIVVQAPTALDTTVSVPVGAANTTYTGPYLPDFNNAWYTGSGTPMMFVAGTDAVAGAVPTLYGVGFASGGVLNTTATSSTPLATGAADSSPVSEFYNASLAEDLLFVGVTNNCIATNEGGTSGCIMSLNITGGFPTVTASSTALPAPGGPSGIIPDNDSNLFEASSVYYVTKSGATLVKATQAGLN
jgi:hypothetical protein